MRRPQRPAAVPGTAKRRLPRRLPILLLVVPLLAGLFVAPPPATVHGDELSAAQARQKELAAKIKAQKAQISQMNALQASLQGDIASTKTTLNGITADLTVVRKKVNAMVDKIAIVKANYEELVAELADLDTELRDLEGQEAAKKQELGERKQLLADRIRAAYDTNRTSLIETILSGQSFADILAEMSYFIDVGEQDRALAEQIAKDRETLLALHQTTEEARDHTNVVRQETAQQKRELDAQLVELKKAQAELKRLEKETKRVLAQQQAAYTDLVRNKAALSKAIRRNAAAQNALKKKIDDLVAAQYQHGNVPSQYNGTLQWPMAGYISGEYGCTNLEFYGPGNGCAHYHNGIDIVNACGTPVKAAGAGVVAYIGWNYADGADPAWIVVIAHSTGLRTWYAHMRQYSYPGGIGSGSHVRAGQVIGYEASTGRSTGCHLHWMVEQNGNFVNPRLFV